MDMEDCAYFLNTHVCLEVARNGCWTFPGCAFDGAAFWMVFRYVSIDFEGDAERLHAALVEDLPLRSFGSRQPLGFWSSMSWSRVLVFPCVRNWTWIRGTMCFRCQIVWLRECDHQEVSSAFEQDPRGCEDAQFAMAEFLSSSVTRVLLCYCCCCCCDCYCCCCCCCCCCLLTPCPGVISHWINLGWVEKK